MFKERTPEFAQITERLRLQMNSKDPAFAAKSKAAMAPNYSTGFMNGHGGGNGMTTGAPKLQFTIVAGQIGKQIHETTTKLQNLTKLARNTSLFDDKADDIYQLTTIIKQDIQGLNHQIDGLEQHVETQRALRKNKQTENHTNTIVSALKSKLARTTKKFQSVLETRTQNLKVQQEKRQRFGGPPVKRPDAFKPRPVTFAPSYGQDGEHGEVAIQIGGMQQQQSLLGMQDSYIASRTTAVENIESTIIELQGIFTHLANLVAEQGEMMQRIDENVDTTLANVGGAQDQLIKYMQSISGNRMLAFKMFAVLAFFIVIFVVFFL